MRGGEGRQPEIILISTLRAAAGVCCGRTLEAEGTPARVCHSRAGSCSTRRISRIATTACHQVSASASRSRSARRSAGSAGSGEGAIVGLDHYGASRGRHDLREVRFTSDRVTALARKVSRMGSAADPDARAGHFGSHPSIGAGEARVIADRGRGSPVTAYTSPLTGP